MDKKIAALLGAAAAVATVGGAQAATQPAAGSSPNLQASSYADLLTPVPNAVEQLEADNAVRAQIPADTGVKLAQDYHHHHHHHHDTVIIKRHRRHHHHHHHHHRHHHHHHGAFIGIPGVGGVVVHSDRD